MHEKVQEHLLPHCQAVDFHPLLTDSPSVSYKAMQNKRVHLSIRLWGTDRTDVEICTADAQIYHVWHNTANKGEMGAIHWWL